MFLGSSAPTDRTGVTSGRAAARGRAPGPHGRGWLLAGIAVALLALAPILAIVAVAGGAAEGVWPHLVAYVLPEAMRQTAVLVAGVGILVVVMGTCLAWLVVAYDFPGRRLLEWALLLPLAMPTYIVAYAYLDVLHPIGPVQSFLRALFGITNPRDLSFPDVRSMGGCILLLSIVLYPYVYASVRATFLVQAGGVVEASHSLGAGRFRTFLSIAVPLARPAIVAGATLALLETLNDIGASEFLGVRTLTVSIYATWINRSSLAGAAQIALFMLAVVITLVVIERIARRHADYADAEPGRLTPKQLRGWGAVAATFIAAMPVFVGFVIPVLHLCNEAYKRLRFAGFSHSLLDAIRNTASLALVATAVTLALGACVIVALRLAAHRGPRQVRRAGLTARIASLGYAVPGTVLAIGLMVPLATIDNAVDAALRASLGISTGLVLSGTVVALIYAYAVRFLALAVGGLEAGLGKVPLTLDDAARTLGAHSGGLIRRIHLPLLWPAIASAAILIFVDCMKELPATLLLRPLDFETLATQLYAEASRGTYEDGAIAALLIVLVGFLPVVWLARLSRHGWVRPHRATSGRADDIDGDLSAGRQPGF
ncbi:MULTISPECIES: iron ABC transporter permease [unclassified Chelatococcus]|uniref:ABC transporter permease n=1 Tax=unclassified Chelatococcus TaxID=2638111 RepID=UPI001BD002EC|nr:MULTISPECIES: iron ABC transporter permease [unclassified Chelatococcus]MBS7698505.1 iron ABC transporter permease [Chelatococcus sp. YT9]MBX3554844.1 iron ABC transporter permease [Chelatococcus sp.]